MLRILKVANVLMSALTRYKWLQYRGSELVYKLLVLFSSIYKAFFVAKDYVIVPTPYGKLFLPKTGYAANRIITFMLDLIEPQWRNEFESTAKNVNCMIDVGAASDGYYSLKACRLNPKILVIALEPSSSEYYWLINNVVLNKLFNNVKVLKYALGNSINCMIIDSEYVKCLTLDELVTKHAITGVNVIKIDVEGSGYEVITGGMNTIKRYKPVIFFEVHNVKERGALKLLRKLGYDIIEKPGDMYIAFPNIIKAK